MDLFQQIDNIALLEPSNHFDLFQAVSNALNSSDSDAQTVGRNHLIRVIDMWENVPTAVKPMWEDLIEAVGFYPYMEKYKMSLTDLDSRIRREYHRSEYISDKTLHSKQKELSDLLISKKNVVVSAPTSFGKSLLIEEIVASGIYTNVVIIQPTLALLDETRIKLKGYSNQYKVIVQTSQEASSEKGNVVIPLAQPNRSTNGNNQTLNQRRAKTAAAEAERKLVQIGLKIFLVQAMIGAKNKSLGVADDDVQPVEKAGIRIIGSVFVGVAFQRGNVTAIAVAVDHAAISKDSVGKFLHSCLLEIGCHIHFQKEGIAPLIQRQCHKNLRFFCAPAPLFACRRATKVRIIKFDDAVQLMSSIPLPHSNADASEHEPSGFVSCSDHCCQLNG